MRLAAWSFVAAGCLWLLPQAALAGGGPEKVLLLVNVASADSRVVAQEYARLRGIPPSNVLMLRDIPPDPVIPLASFRDRILGPALEAIRSRGLAGQIDYIVYSAGFPYAVDILDDMKGRQLPFYDTQPASITGLTYLADMVMVRDRAYLTMDANWYAGGPRHAATHRLWGDSPGTGEVEVSPPRPFRHATRWGVLGTPSDEPRGRSYYLSCMLAYVGSGANTRQEALECLRRSAAADGTHPVGTVYFMASSDRARTGPRQWAFEPAAAALRKMGVRASVLPGVLPPHEPAVAGTMTGTPTFAWKDCGSRILPGAFCDNLTSGGAVMTGGGQTLLSEFIRAGAAGASGTVAEPYNLQTKFPTAFVHMYYAAGCTLAEAFYQSVCGPYQQLLVGDPLCRPWARIPTVHVQGLSAGQVVKAPVALRPSATGGAHVVRWELYVDGRRTQTCGPGGALALRAVGLAPGQHEARVVALTGPLEVEGRQVVPFRVAR